MEDEDDLEEDSDSVSHDDWDAVEMNEIMQPVRNSERISSLGKTKENELLSSTQITSGQCDNFKRRHYILSLKRTYNILHRYTKVRENQTNFAFAWWQQQLGKIELDSHQ